MKIKFRLGLIALVLALSTLALSSAALACRNMHRCWGHCGVVYNQEDGRYYPVANDGDRRCMSYRVVDDKYIPVASYRYHCKRMHHHHRYACYHRMVPVTCEVRPAHWWVMHWIPASNVCYYRF